MKVEQACRFRTIAGYAITAKTVGFDRSREKALTEVFNDSMRPLFNRVGESVLSCAINGSYAFYSRSTLRSHINREVIFTHSYILPANDYVVLMREMPECLLAVPEALLMNAQSCEENMQLVEFPNSSCGKLSIDELFAKYQLTPERYSRLLMGAYEAMTSNRSLRLYTDVAAEQREQVARELTYCIVEGLLPVLKGKVSFSSREDARMKISILGVREDIREDELVFGVEDDSCTNIQFRDDWSKDCFETLGRMNLAERRMLLQRMEEWLSEVVNIETQLTFMLICIAYAYQHKNDLTQTQILKLFRMITKAAGRSIPLQSADALLSDFVQYSIERNAVTTKLLSNVAEWYLQESSSQFRSLADQAFSQATEEVCVALVNAIIDDMPVDSNTRELMCVLVKGISINSRELTADENIKLLHWIIRENIAVKLSEFCNPTITSYTDTQKIALARCILIAASQREFNSDEMTAMVYILSAGLKDKGVCLTSEDYQMIDAHIAEFRNQAMEKLVKHYLNVRIRRDENLSLQVETIRRLGSKNKAFRDTVVNILASDSQNSYYACILEYYVTQEIFSSEISGEQIGRICSKYNIFLNASGPFEKKVTDVWNQYVRVIMKAEGQQEKGLQRVEAARGLLLREVISMKVSDETKHSLSKFIWNEYWRFITYKNILESEFIMFPDKLVDDVSSANLMRSLMRACGKIMNSPTNTQDAINLLMHNQLSEQDQVQIRYLMYRLACQLILEKKFISWDLLLMYCWLNGKEYDLELLNSAILNIERKYELYNTAILYGQAKDSVLLNNEKLRKALKKTLSRKTILGERLMDELRWEPDSTTTKRGQRFADFDRHAQKDVRPLIKKDVSRELMTESRFVERRKAKKNSNPFIEQEPTSEKKGFRSIFRSKEK